MASPMGWREQTPSYETIMRARQGLAGIPQCAAEPERYGGWEKLYCVLIDHLYDYARSIADYMFYVQARV